jgi:CRP-like cAMP-binding protein
LLGSKPQRAVARASRTVRTLRRLPTRTNYPIGGLQRDAFIEQRAAKWIIATAERAERDQVPLTHEQLGMLLGVGRSYVSRVIQKFKAARLLETRRKAFLVKNAEGLQAKACLCDAVSKRHFDEVMDGLYPEED